MSDGFHCGRRTQTQIRLCQGHCFLSASVQSSLTANGLKTLMEASQLDILRVFSFKLAQLKGLNSIPLILTWPASLPPRPSCTRSHGSHCPEQLSGIREIKSFNLS